MRSKQKKALLSLSRVLFVLSVFLSQLSLRVKPGDDEIYKNSLSVFGSLLDWMVYYYTTWSGRVIPCAAEVLLLQLPVFCFMLVNTAAILWCIWFVCRYFAGLRPEEMPAGCWGLWVLLVLLFNRGVREETVFWCSGSVSYFWGLAAAFVVIRLYLHPEKGGPVWQKVFAVIACLYTMSYEQSGIFTLCFCGAIFFWRMLSEKKADLFLAVLWVFGAAVFLICLTAPGNANRTATEVLQRYPSFLNFALADKLRLGIGFALTGLQYYSDYLLCGTALCLAASLFLEKKGWAGILLAGGCAGYYGVSFFWRHGLPGIRALGWLYGYANFEVPSVFADGQAYAALFFGLFFFLLLGGLLFAMGGAMEKDGRCNLTGALLFFAAFFETMAISFSPTLHVSGSRIHFYSHAFCLILLFCGAARCVRGVVGQLFRGSAVVPGGSAPRPPLGLRPRPHRLLKKVAQNFQYSGHNSMAGNKIIDNNKD